MDDGIVYLSRLDEFKCLPIAAKIHSFWKNILRSLYLCQVLQIIFLLFAFDNYNVECLFGSIICLGLFGTILSLLFARLLKSKTKQLSIEKNTIKTIFNSSFPLKDM